MAGSDSAPSIPARRRGLGPWAILALVLVGAAVGGTLVSSWPQIVERIGARLPFLAANNSAPADQMPSTLELQQQLSLIEAQLRQLDARNSKAEAADVAMRALDTRVLRLETQNPAGIARDAAAAITLAELIRLSESGQPFASHLVLLRSLLPNAPELDRLSQYAGSGVASEASLAQRFDAVADAAMAAVRQARANGWFARQWQRLASLVSVRRVGSVQGNDSESRLARAGQLMVKNDLSGAMDEMRALPPEAREAANAWLRDAEARLSVDHDTAAIAATLAKHIAATSMETPP